MLPELVAQSFDVFGFCFQASDFTLKPSDCPDTEFPVRIADSDRGCLWYKKDNKFKIPKGEACPCCSQHVSCFCVLTEDFFFAFFLSPAAAYIRFHIISPVIQQSARK